MHRTRRENAVFVLGFIRALGVEPHRDSRLMQMVRVLTASSPIVRQDDPQFEIALEAERDITQLAFVFEHLKECPRTDEFVVMIKKLVKDSALPQSDRGHSKGRDVQFELFVAALCQASGLTPVSMEEPDVTCCVSDIKFGIAAKRLKQERNLEPRLSKAADQIANMKLPGIIALDTCIALNRNNERISAPISDHEFGRAYKTALNRFVKDYHTRIQECVRAKGVRGIVIHDNQVRMQPDGQWSLAGMTYWVCTTRGNLRRSREFSLFRREYMKGLPNLERA